MKTRIAAIDKAIEEKNGNLQELGINTRLFWAYRHSLEAENEVINFSEPLWDADIAPIVKTFRENGIKEFTITCNFSGLISTLALFDKEGCTMDGIVEVKETYLDFRTNEKAVAKAIKMIIK